ncbi:ecdysteroid 22-kinase family protein [Geoalkalibacter halelectricus]|uniref:Ecdysteroid 22-kinase family protein n=1 Tax=Geoalkalibacter halelectricus TaxID=2847045 RepID=A0ABY5ZSN6_9BACT|nr:ecdysteroid 22-kinase family protein [Geoalkalibacter halelectricus]MDO3377568.1 ecdysteroid 22-kinase family protein [Geoalkalibacter halelectricus]UWZ80674.1 ecdysteroid 22-kinase family protein [Geoalkalibacter halelectricus]
MPQDHPLGAVPGGLETLIREATGAREVRRGERIQSLWSGYGEIVRYALRGGTLASVVVKDVVFPSAVDHPRGWHNDVGHQRKVRSYEVEMAWYRDWSGRCDEHCRVPRCFALRTLGERHLMVLEDLDAAGLPLRKERLDRPQALACLSWLAHFHARFLGEKPTGLWPIGSYWHLATRQEEWQVIEDAAIRRAAATLDVRLNTCRFQTLVHGDAKVANFCFSTDGRRVAAVDFQYVGGGCGMKDVAYFLGSCLAESEQRDWEADLLDAYFAELRRAVNQRGKDLDFAALEAEWRALFPLAQADFYRFLVGWCPEHWKIHDYSRKVALAVVAGLDGTGA